MTAHLDFTDDDDFQPEPLAAKYGRTVGDELRDGMLNASDQAHAINLLRDALLDVGDDPEAVLGFAVQVAGALQVGLRNLPRLETE